MSGGHRLARRGLDIRVKDANALPGIRATLVDDEGDALTMQPDSVMEGETLMVKLTAIDEDDEAMKAGEKLMVSLVPAGTAGVQDSASRGIRSRSPAVGSRATPVDLMVVADDDVGEEMLVFDFYLWDAAVPTLPIIAQFLLAVLLGLGGYRRYLRRR